MIRKLIAKQLRSPRGLLGQGIAKLMNHSNQSMHTLCLTSLQVQPLQRVLDIGFGGGLTFELLSKQGHQGSVVGIETSTTMLKRARKRSKALHEHLYLVQADAHRLPLAQHSFDCACTINTLYFWHDPGLALHQIKHCLTHQGRLVIGFRPKQAMQGIAFTQHGFQHYTRADVEQLLKLAGYTNVEFQLGKDSLSDFYCAIALNTD